MVPPPWARALLGAAGVVALLSFGGQIVLGPVLIPLFWLVARRTRRAERIGFTILASLLAAEVIWILGYLLAGQQVATVAAVVGGAASLVTFGALVRRC